MADSDVIAIEANLASLAVALIQFSLGNGNPTRERGLHCCVFFPRLRVLKLHIVAFRSAKVCESELSRSERRQSGNLKIIDFANEKPNSGYF